MLSVLSIFPFPTLPGNMDLGILQLFGFYQKEFAPSKEPNTKVVRQSCFSLPYSLASRITDKIHNKAENNLRITSSQILSSLAAAAEAKLYQPKRGKAPAVKVVVGAAAGCPEPGDAPAEVCSQRRTELPESC